MHRKGQSCRIQSQPHQFTPLVQQQLLVIVYLQKKGHETKLKVYRKSRFDRHAKYSGIARLTLQNMARLEF